MRGTKSATDVLTPEVVVPESEFARLRQSWVSMVDIVYDGLLEAI